jgi:hypothetical protein
MSRPAALALLLAMAPAAQAQVRLAPDNRVSNRPPGVCVWACLESAGRCQGVDALSGLAADRARQALRWERAGGFVVAVADNSGTADRVEAELQRRGVRYRMAFLHDTSLIEAGMRSGRPVCVSLVDYPNVGQCHEVLLLEWDVEEVRFYDPNDPAEDQVRSRAWFEAHWLGRSVLLGP